MLKLPSLTLPLACGLFALCAFTASAHADQTSTVLGGGIGAAAGAVIGQSVGGRHGAVIGAAVGGATGAAVGNSMGREQHQHRASGPQEYNRQVGYHQRNRHHWDHDDDRRPHGKRGHNPRGRGYGHDKHDD